MSQNLSELISLTYVIVPIYNNCNTLSPLIEKLSSQVEPQQIIIVNDGSTDDTKQELLKHNDIICLHHEINRGKGAALKTGFSYAMKRDCEYIVTLDSDGQHEPEDIPKFIKRTLETNADIIIGSRMNNLKQMPFHRIVSNKITSFLVSRKIKQPIKDSQSGYRLFKCNLLKEINLRCNYFDLETEVLLKAGRKNCNIEHVNIDTIYPQYCNSAIKVIDVFRFIKAYLSN